MRTAFIETFNKEKCIQQEDGTFIIPQNTTLYITMKGYINPNLSSEFKNGCLLRSFEPPTKTADDDQIRFVCGFRLLANVNAIMKNTSQMMNIPNDDKALIEILNDSSVDVFFPHKILNQLRLTIYYKQ